MWWVAITHLATLTRTSPALSRKIFLQSTAAITLAAAPLPNKHAAKADTQLPPSKVGITSSGVKFFDIKEGRGYSPNPGQIVIIRYKSFLSSGKQYDSSEGPGRKPLVATFKASPPQMLPGWEDAIETMREGGTRIIQVPAPLAYGEKGVCLEGGECLVPPNEKLQFELTLERVALDPGRL